MGGSFSAGLLPGFEGFRLQDGLLWAEGAAAGDPGHPVTTLYVGNLPPQVWGHFIPCMQGLLPLQGLLLLQGWQPVTQQVSSKERASMRARWTSM